MKKMYDDIFNNDKGRLWLIYNFCPALLPSTMTAIIAIATTESYFKLNDVIFIGLSMNISNLNLIGQNATTSKMNMTMPLSLFFTAMLSVCLSTCSIYGNGPVPTSLLLISTVLVIASIALSYKSNVAV